MKEKYFQSKLYIEPIYAVLQKQEYRAQKRNIDCLELIKEWRKCFNKIFFSLLFLQTLK